MGAGMWQGVTRLRKTQCRDWAGEGSGDGQTDGWTGGGVGARGRGCAEHTFLDSQTMEVILKKQNSVKKKKAEKP